MTAVLMNEAVKAFGATLAVDRVTLDIPSGSTTAIVGPSGSGKTTVLRLLAGFEQLDHGTITLGDDVVADLSRSVPAHRRLVGYVSQDGGLFPYLSVAENIRFGMGSLSKVDARRAVTDLLELVSLDPALADRGVDELSGGQQQRVALARALARQPRVMLLDEPFSALDTDLRASTRRMVSEVLAGSGITTVLVTHDRTEALSFADQVAVMRAGRIEQVGSPSEVYENPATLFAAQFLGPTVVLDAEVASGVADTLLGRIPVHPDDASGAARVMLRHEQLAVRTAVGTGSGLVRGIEYQGADMVVSIRLHDGHVLPPVRITTDRHLKQGDTIDIRVDGSGRAFGLVGQ
ncbi:MAG: malK [Rhodoglobus sp.]|nr:malK [Rhodoglobus sp.]